MNLFKTYKRYYLNGIDFVMAGLNLFNQKQTGLGNHSHIVLVLDGLLDKNILEKRLSKLLSDSLFYNGKIKRAWHLAPYWAPEKQIFQPFDLGFFHLRSPMDQDLDKLLQNIAISPFKNKTTLLGFDLVHCDNKTYLIMKFNHKMFDARGAEALLEYILNDQDHDKQLLLPCQGPQLNLWKTRFLSGQHINRFLRSIFIKNIKVASLKQNNESGNKHNFFYSSFSKEQTRIIDDLAEKNAGYLMNGIYLLTCASKSFCSLFNQDKSPGNILIPINIDIRENKFKKEKIFFNNLSFMLFNLKKDLPLNKFLISLKSQFIDQIKKKIPFHFMNAALLMRIMPLSMLARFMNFRMKKNPCSFSFSYISEQAFNLKSVYGHNVINLFHMPIVPFDPGIGVFFTRFNKTLNVIVSSFNTKLSEKDGKSLHKQIVWEVQNGKI